MLKNRNEQWCSLLTSFTDLELALCLSALKHNQNICVVLNSTDWVWWRKWRVRSNGCLSLYSTQDEEVLQAANRCALCAVASFTLSYKDKQSNRISAMGIFFSSHCFSRLFFTCEDQTAREKEWTMRRRRRRRNTFPTCGIEIIVVV